MNETAISENSKNTPREYYFEKFKEIDPVEVTGRTGVKFDDNKFVLEVLDHTLYVEWPDFKLVPKDADCPKALYDFKMEIIAARFLIESRSVPSSGQFKAYRDLPWGELYDANFQGRCIKRFAYTFGYKIDLYNKVALHLGGVKLDQSDAGYDYTFLPDIICKLLIWAPDEEFPPSAQILFSDNIQFAFNAEDLAVVGDIIIGALSEVSKSI